MEEDNTPSNCVIRWLQCKRCGELHGYEIDVGKELNKVECVCGYSFLIATKPIKD